MADDTPFANGAGPAPRRRMYAAPFGMLQTDTPPIQYGDASSGPTQGGINTLAARGINPIASPFGMLPTAGFTSQPPPPATLPAPAPQPIAAPFGALQSAPMPPPQFNTGPAGDAASQGPQTWPPPAYFNALMRALRRF
jgi:hypothetical protein